MINKQLLDYIENQLKVGVGKEVIRSALVESGWSDVDVREALNRVASNAKAPAAAIRTTDIFQPPDDPVFQPRAAISVSGGEKRETRVVPGSRGPAKGATNFWGRFGRWALPVLGAIVILVFGGASYMFYVRARDAADRLSSLEKEKDSLAVQVAEADRAKTQIKDDLENQLMLAKAESEALKGELGIFRTPSGEAPGATEVVVVKGTLRGGGKEGLSVMTANDIVVTVTNFKDEKVSAALLPLVGSVVEISGTHVVGSREISVSSVNGTPI